MSKLRKILNSIDNKEALRELWETFDSMQEIYDYYGVSRNSSNQKIIYEKLNELNLPLDIWRQKHTHIKICLNCGKQYNSKYNNSKFCSHSCSATYNNKKRSHTTKINVNKSVSNAKNKKEVNEGVSNVKNKKENKLKVCKFCGQEHCEKIDACSYQSVKWFKQLECFGFDLTKIGTIEIHKEYNKVKELLYKEYWDNCLSVAEIKEKYQYPYIANRLYMVMKRMNIQIRDLSEAIKNTIYQGITNIPQPTKNYRYKHGIHISWNNKQFFLRSSYEFEFAKQLDEKQIEYEVEWCRIKYWDSELNTYRIAIPDFYIPSTNTIYEIKSSWTFIKQNMLDKFKEYKKLGFNVVLVYEKKEYSFEEMINIEQKI